MNEVTYGFENGKRYADFDGIRYWLREKQGYYYSGSKAIGVKNTMMLHRMVFIKHYGEIKRGYHIHHIDGNKDNNEIENLICLSHTEHQKLHAYNWTIERLQQARENLQTNARPKADLWHGSEVGKEWHKKHYEAMKDKLHKKTLHICVVCGKEYYTNRKDSAKCCSNACRAKERRMSGKDNEMRECVICGKMFETNRFTKKKTCSKECASRLNSQSQTGKTMSEEAKEKISKAKSGANSAKARSIVQYDKEDNFIRQWEYASLAAKEYNIDLSHIIKCCRGKLKTAGGYKWKYAE